MKKLLLSTCLFAFVSGVFAQSAVTAWDRIGILIAPGKTSTQIGAIKFGTDPVLLTGDRSPVQEDKKVRTYAKVILEDGKAGWVNEYLLIPDGEAAVVTKRSGAYQLPEENASMLRGIEFTPGEPVIKTAFNGPFVYVFSRNKEKQGWIMAESIVWGGDEVKNALLFQKAMAEPVLEKRIQKLMEIRNQEGFDYLQIAGIINEAFINTNAQAETQTALVYASSEVSINEGENERSVNGELRGKEGNNIISIADLGASTPSITPLEEERSVPQPSTSKEAISYKGKNYMMNKETIGLVEVTDAKNSNGFVCYHKTLPKGAKIQVMLPEGAGFVELEVIGNLTKTEGLGMTKGLLTRIYGNTLPEMAEIRYFTKE